jgi:hypothetical protein
MGLLVIINGFDRLGIQKALMGDSYAIQSRIYEDFTVQWYMDWGRYVCYQLFMSAFFVNAVDIILSMKAFFLRWKDRGFKFNLKRDIENDHDDEPNTKKRS